MDPADHRDSRGDGDTHDEPLPLVFVIAKMRGIGLGFVILAALMVYRFIVGPQHQSVIDAIVVFVALACAMLLWLIGRRRSERLVVRAQDADYGLCMECGYNVGNVVNCEHCPECGTPVDRDRMRRGWQRAEDKIWQPSHQRMKYRFESKGADSSV